MQYYSETYSIRTSEVQPDGTVSLPALAGLMQEIAGNHAMQLHFDITDLHRQGLTWVLHRLHIKLHSLPKWRQSIHIETWPAAGDGLRAFRDFRITSQTGEVMAEALSYWMMLDLTSRRPVRMPKEVLQLAPNDVEHVIEPDNARIKLQSAPEKLFEIHVLPSDLDMNAHVNNVRYIQWITDTLELKGIKPKELDIHFLSELRIGESLYGGITEIEEKTAGVLTNAAGYPVAIGVSLGLF